MQIEIKRDGNLTLLTPLDAEATQWVGDNVVIDAWQWVNNSVYCEDKNLRDVIRGFIASGGEIRTNASN